MIKVINENIITPVAFDCDVLVCGGGFAGISAALSAARCGASVILIEKEYMLGGLGTSGLITIYLPLCDGCGHQVSFGVAEELFRLSISMGAEDHYPENWLDKNDPKRRTQKDKRFQVRYNPNLFAILAEQLLNKEGVKILYGTYAVATRISDKKIDTVIVENKSGRQAIVAKSVVDATGDCDIASFADAPTKLFQQGNLLAAWYYYLGTSGYQLRQLGLADIPDEYECKENEVKLSTTHRFSGIDGEELSDLMILSHSSTLEDIVKSRKKDASVIPTMLATIPQIRMTRKLIGEYILSESEVHKYFDDSVGLISDWRKRGPVYEVPFRTLYSKKIKNLIVAGRCTSVTDEMWDIMRVIPCCAVTGQAAGTAAAISNDFSKLDIKLLQKKLEESGVVIHEIKR